MLLKVDLSEAENELNDIYSMSEEAVCFRYQCNSKEQAIQLLNECIEELSLKIERLEERRDNEHKGWSDPAFRSEADFYRMRI